MALVAVGCFVVLDLVSGYNLLAVLRTSNALRMHGYNQLWSRPYAPSLWRNLAEAALFVGPLAVLGLRGAAAAVRRRAQGPRLWALTLALLVTVLTLDLSGKIRGETSRMWLFLSPFFATIAGGGAEGDAPRWQELGWLILCAVYGLALARCVLVWGF
jgi:hypothetical protein